MISKPRAPGPSPVQRSVVGGDVERRPALGWVVTSIERTAYPRFKRLITTHELHLFFSPTREDLEWAADATDRDEHLPALLLILKSYRRARCRCTGPRGRPSLTVAWSASGSA
ncbi:MULTISPECIES: hypothetical protein [unclassified Streptomyces]|uniref:hypothetical protein n=1 Tax=unclassified Streptomyces TaxID=2593676 RepID=UPI0022545B4A|nr:MULTISPECIES: hypothetical protein [unclassified Streptomyces]MCX5504896.1 DUF4158 domain-containing protein [Streptomyces sp. NBC_00052]MCX5546567.1 DUF4158 domain-containing protein [Streptomyces sp. NBC_00051]WSC32438.1 DUF4158 domain-containing protein [Streptomyces sp. NBC_01768]WSX05701.1 DUF4158 domain-containing protein [Streptomyces sp. NBC_00987]